MCDKIELRYGNKDQHQIKMLDDIRQALSVEEKYLKSFKRVIAEQDKFRGSYLYNYNEKLAEIVYGPNQQCLF